MTLLRWIAGVWVALASLVTSAGAQQRVANLSMSSKPTDLIGFDQKLGAAIPRGLALRDESGAQVELCDLAGGKPMVLALVYFSCPRLCTEVLNGSVRTLRALELKLGSDFHYVAVSIDPHETPELAAEKKRYYLASLGKVGVESGWHFLTGDEASIERLASTVGFRYVYDETSQSYAHDGGVMVVTPDGRISHYFFGIEYSSSDLRLALVDASAGRIGTLVDHVLLLCFHYDPVSGRYGFAVMSALRLAALLTLAALGTFMVRGFLRDRRNARVSARTS